MRKLLLLLIFGGVAFQYYNRDQQIDMTPNVNLNDWAVKLTQLSSNNKKDSEKLVCPNGHYVSVNYDLSEATCRQRTQL
ncbi:hypothetical protein LG272_07695 [Pseudidiomarina marina]|uniref:Uncharacterized protein n=1 Tax=Pseudidiomarina marina TaxID=502366 RepID=A0A432YJM3_9GAMM|nr:hypothetical protein [Pseudidiomarina marina]PHR66876.1 MAG: hypothetical protein COA51_00245 [Idiomarina sp.]RUO61140.1 hypothetical protein CWI76_02405 [Pseudidiomarina marina]